MKMNTKLAHEILLKFRTMYKQPYKMFGTPLNEIYWWSFYESEYVFLS